MKRQRRRLRRISEAEKKQLIAKDPAKGTFEIKVKRSDIRHESHRGTTTYTGTVTRTGEDGLPYKHVTVVQQSAKKRAVNRNKANATVERFIRDEYRNDNAPRLEDGTIVRVTRKRKVRAATGEKFTVSEYEKLMATINDTEETIGNAEQGTSAKVSKDIQQDKSGMVYGRKGGNIWGL